MAGLSDVLGGVYNDDDPTPDHHEATALEERPATDETEPATVWDLDDDSDDDEADELVEASVDGEEDDEVVVRVFVPQADDDDDDIDSVEAMFDEEAGVADEPDVDEEPGTPVWNLDSPVDDQEIDWTPEAPVPWDQVSEPETNGHGPENGDDARAGDNGISSRSFGMLAASAAAVDDEADDGPAPWLRADDDILPTKKKKGLFRRG